MGKPLKERIDVEYKYARKPFFDFQKRFFDILFSLLFIILFSPLMIIIALLVAITSPGPVFYVHHRVGKNGKDFGLLKFRTMKRDARKVEEILTPEEFEKFLVNLKLEDDPRVTKFGKALRKTSLDELPQLFNILAGQMSFVGPRPIIREYELPRLGDKKDLFLSVKPGLTGYWGAHGRNSTSYEDRIKMELYYVTKRSAWLDLMIVLKTVTAVISMRGAV